VPPDYYRPDAFKFGGGANDSMLHPAVLVAMLIAIVLMLALHRKYVMIPLLAMTFLVPGGQQVYVLGMHVFVLRILILVGCARMLWTRRSLPGGMLPGGFKALDNAFLWWAIVRALTFVLLYLDPGAVVNRFGFLWDALGGYFLLRYLIRDQNDVNRVLKCLAVLSAILGVCMINEQHTRHNVFGVLGGVREVSEIRDGRIRSQAAFQHPLLAGAFGGTLFPLFVLLWKYGRAKLLASVGFIACVVMVVTSATSTSLLALGAGIFGLLFWPFRERMRVVRWAIVLGLVALQLVMHAPVWYVIARVDLAGGSSSYHRAVLIDYFVRHFGDWWLLGTKSNADWGADMWDTCNQYVQEGEEGGLATLVAFLAMLVISFRWIGKARRSVRGNRSQEFYYWIFGAALFSHIVGFFGISYFDQTRMAWFALLAMISATTLAQMHKPAVLRPAASLTPEPAPELAAQLFYSEQKGNLVG
jgi:hypothetical protein